MSFAISDSVDRVLASALDGVSLRQNVLSDNIANVDTPGFRARSVDFESSLRSAIDSGEFNDDRLPPLRYNSELTDTPIGPNGNSVDLRKETLAAVQTQFQYQMLSRAVTDRYGVLKSSIGTA